MKEITAGFENISFHDASLNQIRREPGSVSIEFEGAFLRKGHPDSESCDWIIESGTLILTGVTGEDSIFWYGDRISKPHPESEFPLDEIMHASFDGNCFSFDGFLKGMPWYEWFVKANGFKIMLHNVRRAIS